MHINSMLNTYFYSIKVRIFIICEIGALKGVISP